MAMKVEATTVGVDVAKEALMVSIDGEAPFALENSPKAIRTWLKGLHGPLRLALESTGVFHLELACQAHARGHAVYLIDGFRLNRYREGVGGRAKTDASDARLLVRYLRHEGEDLRRWIPPSGDYLALQRLLHRRATAVRSRTAVQQSLRDLPELRTTSQPLLRQFDRAIAVIERRIADTLLNAGWQHQARRCRQLEGVGPVTAAALVMAFSRGPFTKSDAFIAFLGLDVRIRDSGKKGSSQISGIQEMGRLMQRWRHDGL